MKNFRKKRCRKNLLIIVFILVLWAVGMLDFQGPIRRGQSGLSEESRYRSQSVAEAGSIPDYAGRDYIFLNNGVPNFNTWELENIHGEHYAKLDLLGRCGCAYAMLDRTMMPEGEREDIGQIRPTGWVQKKYEGIVQSDPPYLYNRCHLIAYALTGQNANERNLITGTRYLNATTMLPWEELVMKYLDKSGNHVLYRVTPYFKERELLARGVEMEAYSVEDMGASLCFHVFLYNIQPGIVLDYATGKSQIDEYP